MKKLIVLIFLFINLFASQNITSKNNSALISQEFPSVLTLEESKFLEDLNLNIYVTNWEPFTIHRKIGVDGISVGVWEEILSISNIKSKYIKDRDFAEALRLIKKDKNGMIIATSSTKDREVYGAFTKPIISFPVAIATKSDEDFIIDLKELKGKRVAVGENYTAFHLLKKHFPEIDLVPVKDTLIALDLLEKGEVYGAADILPVLIFNMNKYNLLNLKISGTSKFNFDVKFMLNKHNEKYIPILNKLIDSVSDIDKQNILNKWVYTKHVTKVDYTIVYIVLAISIVLFLFMLYRQNILKTNEKKIEQERYRYQKLMESSSDAIVILSLDYKVVDFSKEAMTQWGYSSNEMKQLYIYDIDIAKSKDEIDELANSLNDQTTLSFETVHKRKDGSFFNAAIRATKVSLGENDFIYVSIRDITKQKELDAKLLLQKKNLEIQKDEFESIFKYSKDGIAITDLDTNFLDFNDAYLEISGFTRDELLKKSSIVLTVPEQKNDMQRLVLIAKEKGHVDNFEKESIVFNNRKVFLNMSISLLPDKKRFLIVIKDVTSLKQMENQSRLIHMGEMIGNIAHQWRQPLSVISASASSLKFSLEMDGHIDNDSIVNCTNKIVAQTKYLSKTIDDFRSFIREDKEFRDVSLVEVVRASLSLVEAVFKNNYITVVTNMSEDMIINGNKNELQQALINILNNAKDIIVERVEENNKRLLFISTKKTKSGDLELSITDSAGGIKEDIIDRVFEPYFTTKHKSVGTGIGLSMVDKIIRERHGFVINVNNISFDYEGKEYMGACFSIIFKASN